MSAIFFLLFVVLWLLGFLLLWSVPGCPEPGRSPLPPGLLPSISVIIPARNEEENLPRILGSLRDQSVAPKEVVVVDDHSEDGTASVARRGGARIVQSPPLPSDWFGKTWACWQGARTSSGELLIFLDADTVLEPDGLHRLAAAWVERGGLVSVWPYHRMRRAYERLSAFINIIVVASVGVFTPLGRRRRPRGAFGPCLVCSRSDYFELGGHERVRADILEDMAFGRLFSRAGRSVRLFGGRGTIHFRMYPQGAASIVEGFGKNLATGASRASPLLLLVFLGWITGGFIATFYVVYAAVHGSTVWTVLWLGADLMYAAQLLWILARLGNFGPGTALGFQVPLFFFVFVFLVSLARTYVLGQVAWKGRRITIRSKLASRSNRRSRRLNGGQKDVE